MCLSCRSIQTTDASVSRHRVTTESPVLPWQFRYEFYVLPAELEDVVVSFDNPDLVYSDESNSYY